MSLYIIFMYEYNIIIINEYIINTSCRYLQIII